MFTGYSYLDVAVLEADVVGAVVVLRGVVLDGAALSLSPRRPRHHRHAIAAARLCLSSDYSPVQVQGTSTTRKSTPPKLQFYEREDQHKFGHPALLLCFDYLSLLIISLSKHHHVHAIYATC